ncbi:unnamed protein product [Brassica rapa subsp. trilocularis]
MFNVVFLFLCCMFYIYLLFLKLYIMFFVFFYKTKFFPLMWTPYGASKAPFY